MEECMENKGSKQTFVDYMVKQEVKNGRHFTDDEKKLAWLVWQQCWNVVRMQLRKEMKEIEKNRRRFERMSKELDKPSISYKLKKFVGLTK